MVRASRLLLLSLLFLGVVLAWTGEHRTHAGLRWAATVAQGSVVALLLAKRWALGAWAATAFYGCVATYHAMAKGRSCECLGRLSDGSGRNELVVAAVGGCLAITIWLTGDRGRSKELRAAAIVPAKGPAGDSGLSGNAGDLPLPGC